MIRNLLNQNLHEIARTGKQNVMVGRPEVLSQSLSSFRYSLSVVYQRSQKVSEQNCNVYWSKVQIQQTSKLMYAIYSTAMPLKSTKIRLDCTVLQWQPCPICILSRLCRRTSDKFHQNKVFTRPDHSFMRVYNSTPNIYLLTNQGYETFCWHT